MAKVIIYDKVSWHFPEGKKCPSLEAAKSHFIAIMGWLAENELLSNEGKEIFDLGIDSDFSIASSILNDKGNDIIAKYYSDWLRSIEYTKKINFDILNDGLGDQKNS